MLFKKNYCQNIIRTISSRLLPALKRSNPQQILLGKEVTEKCLRQRMNKPPYVDYTRPYHFQLCFVLKGRFVLTVKNRSYLLAPDDLFLISPFMDHYDSYYKANEPYEVLWSFERNIKRTSFIYAVYAGRGRYRLAHRAGARNTKKEHRLIEQIFDLRTDKAGNFGQILGTLEKLFVSYRNRIGEEMRIRNKNRILSAISPADMERMGKISVHLQQNPTSKISIRDLAVKFCLSVDQMEKLYRKVHGESIKQALIRVRIEQAIDLMYTTRLSLTDLCERIGFENPLYFSRLFKSYCGLSPSAYQQKFIQDPT